MVTGTFDPPSQYKTPFDAEAVREEVLANTRPGYIIFLHDGQESDAEAFAQCVREVIEALKKTGYDFVRIDRLTD